MAYKSIVNVWMLLLLFRWLWRMCRCGHLIVILLVFYLWWWTRLNYKVGCTMHPFWHFFWVVWAWWWPQLLGNDNGTGTEYYEITTMRRLRRGWRKIITSQSTIWVKFTLASKSTDFARLQQVVSIMYLALLKICRNTQQSGPCRGFVVNLDLCFGGYKYFADIKIVS
jgi:hypothetical protein